MNPTTNHLDAYYVSLELIGALKPVIARLGNRDSGLVTQLRRAAASIPLNISEGRRRAGKDRIHLWRIAAGSADEVRACLDVANAWGYLEPSQLQQALDFVDRILAMLWRLTH
jgi:four helix bundle protein